MTIVWELA